MGSCQSYGPFWGTLKNRCRIIIGTQKGTLILTTTLYGYLRRGVESFRGSGHNLTPKPKVETQSSRTQSHRICGFYMGKPYSRSQKVGTSLASCPYGKAKGIPALILLKLCSNFLASTVNLWASYTWSILENFSFSVPGYPRMKRFSLLR